MNLIEEKIGIEAQIKIHGNSPEHTGDNFLSRIPIEQALRFTINKWDLMNLKASVRQRTP